METTIIIRAEELGSIRRRTLQRAHFPGFFSTTRMQSSTVEVFPSFNLAPRYR